MEKKYDNAMEAYFYGFSPLILVDITVFGKAKEGLIVSDSELVYKRNGKRFMMYLENIKTIEHYPSLHKIKINGEDLKYVLSSVDTQMKLIVSLIKKAYTIK